MLSFHTGCSESEVKQFIDRPRSSTNQEIMAHYAFQFKCLQVFAAASLAILAAGMVALCLLTAPAMGIATTAAGVLTAGLAAYGFYQNKKELRAETDTAFYLNPQVS